MEEYLWEIWMGNKNTHHRAQMDANESPRVVMQRIIRELDGSDKAVPTTRRDPNTGQRSEIKWKFAWRSQGKEKPLKNHMTFADQGVTPDALIVVREVEVRAHTIYIDGFDGLQAEEMAATRSKIPMIIGLLVFLLVGGGAAYYFLILGPQQAALAPYSVNIPTIPEGANLVIVMDTSLVPKKKKVGAAPVKPTKEKKGSKLAIDETLDTIKVATPAKRVKIPKKAKIIFISITHKGMKTWTAGHELKKWNKDRLGLKKLIPIDPKELTVKNYFPKTLEKLPPPKPIPALAPPKPTPLAVKYPRRWRRMRVGIDPMNGGLDHQGPKGITKAASDISLTLANSVTKHLLSQRRRFRVTQTRKKDVLMSGAKRAKVLRRRRAKAIIQLTFVTGLKEFTKANKSFKKDFKIIPYNDSVAGFQIYVSKQNRSAKKSQKLATCLGNWMKKAGFVPRAPKKGEPKEVGVLGIRNIDGKDPILDGRTPSVRLIPGYISHRGENAVLNKATTHKVIAQVIEASLICYKKR